MKKVFTNEYPTESISEIEEWIREQMLTKDDGALKDGAYRASIIVEIISNE